MQIQSIFPTSPTHYFTYKNFKIPFNFDLLKKISKYCRLNESEFSQRIDVNLVDKPLENALNFNEKAIKNFVDYSFHKKVPLNTENAVTLNYLGYRYQIPNLIKVTDNFMRIHSKDLVDQIITILKADPSFETEQYKSIFSNIYTELINNESLLSLDISVLFKILSTKKGVRDQKTIDFVFKCLDKYKEKASKLFSIVNFGPNSLQILNRLLHDYSDIFDFRYLNSEIINNLIENQIKAEDSMKKLLTEMNNMKEEMQKMKKEITDLKSGSKNIEIDRPIDKTDDDDEKNNFKKSLAQLKTIINLNIDISSSIFNILNGETQKLCIKNIKYNSNIENIDDILDLTNYLSQKLSNSKFKGNYINILPSSEKDNKNHFTIGIVSQVTNLLYSNGLLDSTDFSDIINHFEEIYIEIDYSSKYFDDIYPFLLEMKKNNDGIKIAIFVNKNKPIDNFFYNNSNISCIKLDQGIKNIKSDSDKGLFEGCSSLVHISIPSSVTEIGKNTFKGCSKIENIIIPSSVSKIGESAFMKCSSLRKVSIPMSVKSIGSFAFCGCDSMTHVYLPISFKKIGENTFKDCLSLKKITSIHNDADDMDSLIKRIGLNPDIKIIMED